MLAQYTLHDILGAESNRKPYYFGVFEDTGDPDIEWPHRHDYYSVIYFTQGEGVNVIDFRECEIKPGRIFMMYPGQIHNWSYSSATKGYILLLDKFFYPFDCSNIPYADIPEKQQSLVESIYSHEIDLHKSEDSKGPVDSVLNGIVYLNTIIIRIIENCKNSKANIPDEIVKLRERVSETLSENLAIQEYADAMQISVDKLNESCKTYLGLTAKQLILEQKITEAKRLQYFTSLSVKEISFKLGFEDSAYFSRLFKNKTSIAPNQFRKKVHDIPKKVL